MSQTDFRDLATTLAAPVPKASINERKGAGNTSYAYVKLGYLMTRLDEVFGPLNWETQVHNLALVNQYERDGMDFKTRQPKPMRGCAYSCSVTVTIHHDGRTLSYSDIGTGDAEAGVDAQPSQIHEMAIKTAATDAFKRALRQIGNAFGRGLAQNGSQPYAPNYDRLFAGLAGAAANAAATQTLAAPAAQPTAPAAAAPATAASAAVAPKASPAPSPAPVAPAPAAAAPKAAPSPAPIQTAAPATASRSAPAAAAAAPSTPAASGELYPVSTDPSHPNVARFADLRARFKAFSERPLETSLEDWRKLYFTSNEMLKNADADGANRLARLARAVDDLFSEHQLGRDIPEQASFSKELHARIQRRMAQVTAQ